MEEMIREYMKALQRRYGFFNDEEIENTPKRIERFWEEWERNRDYSFTVFENSEHYDQMVVLKVPNFYSMCSHHLLPFFGKVAVGYIPQTKICGISKLARLVIKYASQPQLQENMTQQILNGLTDALDTEDVMVVVKARHLCMEMRGVKTQSPEMVTSAISGAFRRQEPREEFMRLIE
ncbi:MAG TPA: GTP cyclohydrolase I [Methanomicrobia archaeon]|nr:GTP cyclohydrolase I [Methanomicrobia archaeon]